MDEVQMLQSIVKRINQSWTQNQIDDLNHFFHEHMIIEQPGKGILADGREACIASYRDFVGRSTILDYAESEPVVHVWGATAMASYEFNMTWQAGGQTFSETGIDLFVFKKGEDNWSAVWRTLLPKPETV